MLMSAQIQLHDLQTINQGQVLSLFHVYGQVQVAIQQSTEERLQISADTRSLIETAAFSLKLEVEQGVHAVAREA